MPSLVPRDVDARLLNALQAEFLGTLLFQFIGSLTGSALGNGLTYAALVYATKHVSGGHLNPALTLATVVSGHMHWMKGLAYIIMQTLGAIVGALLEAALVPGLHLGKNEFRAPGCYYPGHVNSWQLILWEAILTFAFVYVAYAVHVMEPGHGSLSPLAMGLTIWALTEAGGKYTGAALNPARLIGPAIIFFCTPQKSFWLYLLGDFLGALVGGVVATGQFGAADDYSAYIHRNDDGLERSVNDPLLGSAEGERNV